MEQVFFHIENATLVGQENATRLPSGRHSSKSWSSWPDLQLVQGSRRELGRRLFLLLNKTIAYCTALLGPVPGPLKQMENLHLT